MDCIVCRTRCDDAVADACARCGARPCAACARRWALEGAEARCAACNAPLDPEALARMFPAAWRTTEFRAREAARALALERARLASVYDTPFYRLLVFLLDVPCRLADIAPYLGASGYKEKFIREHFLFKPLRTRVDSVTSPPPSLALVAQTRAEIGINKTDTSISNEICADYLFIKHCASLLFQIRREFLALIGHDDEPSLSNQDPPDGRRGRPRGFFCPAPACPGLVLSPGRCAECGARACATCHAPVPDDGSSAHACDPADIASLELIATTAKPCPGCARPITRSEGCNQMFCTVCRTAFDWATGERLRVDRFFHNPHYVAPQANGRAGRAFATLRAHPATFRCVPSAIQAGGPIAALARAVVYAEIAAHASVIAETNTSILKDFYADNADLRALYAIGAIPAAELGAQVERRARLRRLFAVNIDAIGATRARVDARLARVDAEDPVITPGKNVFREVLIWFKDAADIEPAMNDVRGEILALQAALRHAADVAGASPPDLWPAHLADTLRACFPEIERGGDDCGRKPVEFLPDKEDEASVYNDIMKFIKYSCIRGNRIHMSIFKFLGLSVETAPTGCESDPSDSDWSDSDSEENDPFEEYQNE